MVFTDQTAQYDDSPTAARLSLRAQATFDFIMCSRHDDYRLFTLKVIKA